MKEKHYEDYLKYIEQQEKVRGINDTVNTIKSFSTLQELQQMRQDEMEANRIEEIISGGFVPTEEEIDAASFEVETKEIPLPGELYGGRVPTFDAYGNIRLPRVPYRRKVARLK